MLSMTRNWYFGLVVVAISDDQPRVGFRQRRLSTLSTGSELPLCGVNTAILVNDPERTFYWNCVSATLEIAIIDVARSPADFFPCAPGEYVDTIPIRLSPRRALTDDGADGGRIISARRATSHERKAYDDAKF